MKGHMVRYSFEWGNMALDTRMKANLLDVIGINGGFTISVTLIEMHQPL